MINFELKSRDELSVLCLGAHSDDIEIGAGATILSWLASSAKIHVHWYVLCSGLEREREARRSAHDFLAGAKSAHVEVLSFRDGYLPAQYETLKDWFETLSGRVQPDIILTHRHDDAHQDHREVCRHTWSTFRDHLILEYEIPKWDGDHGQANFYVPVSGIDMRRKIGLLMEHFGSQRSKHWFDEETFGGLARLRGMESRAPERFAEAFLVRKCLFAGF